MIYYCDTLAQTKWKKIYEAYANRLKYTVCNCNSCWRASTWWNIAAKYNPLQFTPLANKPTKFSSSTLAFTITNTRGLLLQNRLTVWTVQVQLRMLYDGLLCLSRNDVRDLKRPTVIIPVFTKRDVYNSSVLSIVVREPSKHLLHTNTLAYTNDPARSLYHFNRLEIYSSLNFETCGSCNNYSWIEPVSNVFQVFVCVLRVNWNKFDNNVTQFTF